MHADLPESPDLPETTDEAVPASAAPVNSEGEGTLPAEPTAAAADTMSPAACGAKLAELFPALFQPASAAPPQPVKPIKLRIQVDIQERAPGVFTKRILGIYFSRYTTSNAYLKALTQAPSRFDLDGNAAGEIDIVHRTAAVEELARRRDIAQTKRQAEMQAQRERQRAQATQQAPAEGAANNAPPMERPPARPTRRNDERRPPGPPRSEHGPRGPRPPRPDATPRRDPRERIDRRDQPPHTAPPPAAEPAMPADPAMRERALLLRSFESSPLSKANFCALKRLSETDLDAQLTQARAERSGGSAKRG
jgi:ProP effector